MTNLTLSKKTAFEVTANKAHKLLESLKKYETFKTSNIKDTSYSMKFSGNSDSNKLNRFELTYASILTNDEKDLEELIDKGELKFTDLANIIFDDYVWAADNITSQIAKKIQKALDCYNEE